MRALALASLLLAGCTSPAQKARDRTAEIIVYNQTGAQLWYFSYADCGSSDYRGVIGSDEYVADGDEVSTGNIPPGCYDIYVEDEFGCYAENDTDGNLKAGQAFEWKVREVDLSCGYY